MSNAQHAARTQHRLTHERGRDDRRRGPAELLGALGAALLGLALLSQPLSAGWRALYEADTALDLEAARAQALSIISDAPESADAVAAAGWWSQNLRNLDEPEAILSAAGQHPNPELAFLLARIDAGLSQHLAAGVLGRAEVSGPFGVFDTLDLERAVVPEDDRLPALGTGWSNPADPFRLLLAQPGGWLGPPEPMLASGVYLVAWTLDAARAVDGWLVVEAQGGFNLELDGRQAARLRYCGEQDPVVSWYRVELQPGEHRLRVIIASRDTPRVRVSLLESTGDAATGVTSIDQGGGHWAPSQLTRQLPPAAADLQQRLDQEPRQPGDLMLAAALAQVNGDSRQERSWLEAARAAAPDDQYVQLALANLYLSHTSGEAPEIELQRCQELIRSCREVPGSRLVERWLALEQHRDEDADRLLDELLELAPDNPRVLELWIEEAVNRGWTREAEDSLERLRTILPGSHGPAELQLKVLAGLERWQERNQLLQALATSQPPSIDRVEELASSCYQDEALAMLEQLRASITAPAIDLGIIRLLIEAGRNHEARQALQEAEQRWGLLPAFDNQRLTLTAAEPGALAPALQEVLQRRPWDLELRRLSWRLGEEPFFTPFHVDGEAVLRDQQEVSEEIDAVLLLDQAVERIFADGSSIYYYHGITRALTPTGATQAAELNHLPDSMVLRLRIIKPDGSVVVPPELQPGATDISLSEVEAGDIVEEEYLAFLQPTGASRRGHLSPYTYRFADADRAFGLSEYLLVVPQGIDLLIDGNFSGLEHQDWQEGGLRFIRWRSQSVPPLQPEPFSPPTQELLPWVTYGFGVSWQDVGDAIRDRVLPVLRGSPALSAWAQPLLTINPDDATPDDGGGDTVAGDTAGDTAGGTVGDTAGEADPADSDAAGTAVRRLIDALCDEVEPGRGPLSIGITAGMSFSRGEGNRLGILATVLIEAGWQVDLLLSRPLAFVGSHLEVPNPDAFIQPLLRAEHRGRVVWFDPEEDRRGFDHISPILQGSDALVIPLSDPRAPVTLLDRLPSFANPDLEERQELQVQIDASGNARLVLELAVHAAQAERMLQQLRSIPEDRVDQVYQQLAARFFPAGSLVEGSLTRVEEGAVLRFDMELPAACDRAGETMTCRNLVLVSALSPSLASLAQRQFPLILQLPVERLSVTTLQLPPGWTVQRSPRLLDTRWGSVSEHLEVEEGRLHSELRLSMPAQVVAPQDYPEFARFCHAVDELLSRPPVLEADP